MVVFQCGMGRFLGEHFSRDGIIFVVWPDQVFNWLVLVRLDVADEVLVLRGEVWEVVHSRGVCRIAKTETQIDNVLIVTHVQMPVFQTMSSV